MSQRVQRHVAEAAVDKRCFVPVVHGPSVRWHGQGPFGVAATFRRRAEECALVRAGASQCFSSLSVPIRRGRLAADELASSIRPLVSARGVAGRLGDAPEEVEEALHRRATEANFRVADTAHDVARECGATVPQVAIAWLLHQRGVTSPVIGPRTAEQLEDVLPAVSVRLSDEQLVRLGSHTAPPPTYPQRMLAEQNGIDVERPLARRRPRLHSV